MAEFSKYSPIEEAGQNSQGNNNPQNQIPVERDPEPRREDFAEFEPIDQGRPIHLIIPRHLLDEIRAHFMEMGYEVVLHPPANGAN